MCTSNFPLSSLSSGSLFLQVYHVGEWCAHGCCLLSHCMGSQVHLCVRGRVWGRSHFRLEFYPLTFHMQFLSVMYLILSVCLSCPRYREERLTIAKVHIHTSLPLHIYCISVLRYGGAACVCLSMSSLNPCVARAAYPSSSPFSRRVCVCEQSQSQSWGYAGAAYPWVSERRRESERGELTVSE